MPSEYKYGDFSFYKEPRSERLMKEMFDFLQEDRTRWLAIAEYAYDTWNLSESMRQLLNHQKVQDMGHSTFSMSWVLGNIKHIYDNGWEHYVLLCISQQETKKENLEKE